MMYARMPETTTEERLAPLAPTDLPGARVSIATAARDAAACGEGGQACDRLRISMLGDRPVYRVQSRGESTTIFADTGEPFRGLTQDQAIDLAQRFAPEHGSTLRYGALMTDPDQWTLSCEARRAIPPHRPAVGDPQTTQIHISDQTGDVVMNATRNRRRLGY